MGTWVFDTETLPNRTLFCAKNLDTGEWFDLWRHAENAPARLVKFIQQEDTTLIGFNNRSFDNLIVAAFCQGWSELDIKCLSDDLITNSLRSWNATKKYNLRVEIPDNIDLIEVAPAFVSLKAYGARMHMTHLQEMPIDHNASITADQEPILLAYCHNDVDTTAELVGALEDELLLRLEMSKRYGVDMRSKSDSQMAEQIYITTLGLTRKKSIVPKTIEYTPPEFLKFQSADGQSLLDRLAGHVFDVDPETGHVVLPEFLRQNKLEFGAGKYKLGVGGIHSVHNKKVCHVARDDIICDIDASSFYPSVILECGFVPKALGKSFIDEYRGIYERRMDAKRRGDKSTDATLKIALNGTFGKLASRYSVLYAPELMLAVTLTGQFALLMVIERLESAGALVLSANTDGIAIKFAKEQKNSIMRAVDEFGALSKFTFDYLPYRTLAMKDVNNYIAIGVDKSLKMKGIYAPTSLKKNPSAQVSSNAVALWLATGAPFEDTIKKTPFIHFISARQVTGGGVHKGEHLGKVVRWYQSTDASRGPILYASNGNKVPKTEGSRACMTLSDKLAHPADIDYDWYVQEAIKIATDVGCAEYLPTKQTLFDPL